MFHLGVIDRPQLVGARDAPAVRVRKARRPSEATVSGASEEVSAVPTAGRVSTERSEG
jgi:hypothetical protein